MTENPLQIRLLPERYALSSLPADLPVPYWAWQGDFVSLTRTAGFYSLVCREESVPPETVAERGWRLLHLPSQGDLAGSALMARLSAPLAGAGIAVYALSAFDADYVLLKAERLSEALGLLAAAGFALAAE